MTEIKSILKRLEITKKKAHIIIRGMIEHMDKGLCGRKSSLAMFPSYAAVPTGNEKGEYMACDIGGTNLRVLTVKLKGKSKFWVTAQHDKIHIPRKHKHGNAEALFDFIASAIGAFAERRDPTPEKTIKLGLTWSFPVFQTSIASGIHKIWSKDWGVKGVVGKDVIKHLNAAFKRQSVSSVKVAALCNDTVGTFATGRYVKDQCVMGVILGTGTNAAFPLPVREIKKLKTRFPKKRMIVNMEWGNFAIPFRQEWDKSLDKSSNNPGRHTLEKMVSAAYLGEVARIIFKGLIKKKILFDGKNSFAFEKFHDGEDEEKDIPGIYSKHLSRIDSDHSVGLKDIGRLLAELGIKDTSIEDRKIVKQITEAIFLRSARVSAAAIAAVIKKQKIKLTKPVVIAIDGSLFEKASYYAGRMREFFREEFGSSASRIRLVLSKDGSGVGAAILAAVADQS